MFEFEYLILTVLKQAGQTPSDVLKIMGRMLQGGKMESLNQPSNLQPLPIQCNHNTDGTPCTGQKVVFGRRVQICLKKDGYHDGFKPGLKTVTQFLNGNDLKEDPESHFGLQPVGQGAFGTVTFIDCIGFRKICVLKTTHGLSAPSKYDGNGHDDDEKVALTNRLNVERKATKGFKRIDIANLDPAELNAFMLPEHENICKPYCALIRYKDERELTVITSKSDINRSKGDYTVQALLLEYCSGTELQDQLDKRIEISCQPISRDTIYDIALKTMKGLNSMHQRNLVIMDLKPANIIYNRETGDLKLIDFGLSRVISEHQKYQRFIIGTLGFIAPEHYLETYELSTKGDDWSLGATLLSILFDGKDPDILLAGMLSVSYQEKSNKIAKLFSELDDEIKRSAINKKIKKNNGSIEDYSELVDIIVGLTRTKSKRMSTQAAMNQFQNLFDEGKVTYPKPLSEAEFNGVEPFDEFSPEEINEAPRIEAPTARKGGRIFKWLRLS